MLGGQFFYHRLILPALALPVMVLRRIRVFAPIAALMLSGLGLLWGCGTTGPDFVVKSDPWRSPEERACLASGVIQQTAFVHARSALGGPSVCGAENPFEMSAADNGRVALQPAASLRCPMIPQIDSWVNASRRAGGSLLFPPGARRIERCSRPIRAGR